MAGYIAGIGGANVDIHGQSDAPIVMRDSNPGRLHLSAGGVCRNICDNLCRLGLTVELCSAVGGDAYGDMLRGACTAAGIGTRHLAVFPAQNTSAYISIMDSEGDMLVAMSDMHILKEALTPSYVEATKKRIVRENSNKVYVLCDSSKFHKFSNVRAFGFDGVAIIAESYDEKIAQHARLITPEA